MGSRKVFEDGVLHALDVMAEQSDDSTTKILADLMKSNILKHYNEDYRQELKQGKVHKENVEKAIDFGFSDACVSFRMLFNLTEEAKETEIRAAKKHMCTIKEAVLNELIGNDIEVI